MDPEGKGTGTKFNSLKCDHDMRQHTLLMGPPHQGRFDQSCFFFENISGDAEAIPIISAPLRDGRTYSIWVGSECNVRVWPLRTRFSFGVTERVFYEICGPRNLGTLSWCKNKVGSRSERFPWYIAFALPRGSARLCQWTRGFRYMVM